MDDKEKALFAQLPPAPVTFLLPETEGAKLLEKLSDLDKSYDDCHPEKDLLSFYLSLIITELLTKSIINISVFAHLYQHYRDHTFSPEHFDAACRIVYDWCKTDGANAAKIGFPL
ncbi:MAG: hypothetical protein NTX00_04560 [Candidatus Parcubacteria bacterium]|nr:hypothetical protein [Candidatus Parcubacteria bacterium]